MSQNRWRSVLHPILHALEEVTAGKASEKKRLKGAEWKEKEGRMRERRGGVGNFLRGLTWDIECRRHGHVTDTAHWHLFAAVVTAALTSSLVPFGSAWRPPYLAQRCPTRPSNQITCDVLAYTVHHAYQSAPDRFAQYVDVT